MMIPTNCVMCTIGGLLGRDSYGAAEATGGMDGPSYTRYEVGPLLVQAGLSAFGSYETFHDWSSSCNYMRNHMSDRFAFAYEGSPIGHMIEARREGGRLIFYDHQMGGEVYIVPRALLYYVWPVD